MFLKEINYILVSFIRDIKNACKNLRIKLQKNKVERKSTEKEVSIFIVKEQNNENMQEFEESSNKNRESTRFGKKSEPH